MKTYTYYCMFTFSNGHKSEMLEREVDCDNDLQFYQLVDKWNSVGYGPNGVWRYWTK